MSTNLLISREDRLLRVILNRVEKRNALTFALCQELLEVLEEAENDRSVGVILLGANGSVFCAGMDLAEVLLPDASEQARVHEELFAIGARLRKPIVAAVQGSALAGGLALVANAHVAVAAEGATFGLTEVRVALWPFVTFRAVTLAIGERHALELSLTGRIVGTTEALQWGLIHYVVPASDLDARASEIARDLASASPEALSRGLDFVHQTRGLTFRQAGELAYRVRARAFRSPDFAEGVRAFKEKRAPRWPSLD